MCSHLSLGARYIDSNWQKSVFLGPGPDDPWEHRTPTKLCRIDGRGAQDDFQTFCHNSDDSRDIYVRSNIERSCI